LPGHQPVLGQAGMPPRSHDKQKKYHISSPCAHTFSLRPQRERHQSFVRLKHPTGAVREQKVSHFYTGIWWGQFWSAPEMAEQVGSWPVLTVKTGFSSYVKILESQNWSGLLLAQP
jgi:hypothetical protein